MTQYVSGRSLKSGGWYMPRLVEEANNRSQGSRVIAFRLILAVLGVQPVEDRTQAIPDWVVMFQAGGWLQLFPLFAGCPARDRVASGESIRQPLLDPAERGQPLVSAKFHVGFGESLNQSFGRRLDPRLTLELTHQFGELRSVALLNGLRGLGLDLPESGLFKGSEVVDPDRVFWVQSGKLPDRADSGPQGRSLKG